MHIASFVSLSLSLSLSLMKVDFLGKNDDALHASLQQLIEISKDVFVKTLFPEATHKSEVNTKKLAIISVASNFRVSHMYMTCSHQTKAMAILELETDLGLGLEIRVELRLELGGRAKAIARG